MRGIPLKETLRCGGRLWRWCPADLPQNGKASLWQRSKPTTRFDIFLSHTWATSGRWKFLSLSLQFGWRHVLLTWIIVVFVVEVLTLLDVLPMHFVYETSIKGERLRCPFGGWALYIGVTMSMFALVLAPYGPGFCKHQLCFLDVVSINQLDEEMMQQGIYGLGGFLSASKELRILWSQPYLSRLWCVFELAAFRTANPTGRINMAPLHVEALVAATWVGCYMLMLPLVPSLSAGGRGILAFLPAVIPVAVIFHIFCKSLALKRRLFSELEFFDLGTVQCRNDCDKEFIHGAIVEWYGSLEAFTEYVRGPLREELVATCGTTLPIKYTLIVVTPLVSLGIDVLVALCKGGAPPRAILSYGFGMVLGLFTFYAMAMLRFGAFLCEQFARPLKGNLQSLLQSLGLFLVFMLAIFGGARVASMAYRANVVASILFCFSSFLLTLRQSGCSGGATIQHYFGIGRAPESQG
ncbi:unnamed protein product [Symbiodinium microadriaticum]|nr:unnamed protein product [Symbiodinium microadriaticum]